LLNISGIPTLKQTGRKPKDEANGYQEGEKNIKIFSSMHV